MSDRTVTLTLSPDDVIDAVGALELRAASWASRRNPGQPDARSRRAAHYAALAKRLREAMEKANQ